MRFRKIAMPALGMGIAGFPLRNGAEILLRPNRDYFESHGYSEKVHKVRFIEN